MYQVILVIHLFICIAIIGLVLVQQGKGAEVGAAFGSGASNTFFGSQGSGNFLLRVTGGFALAFFITCLTLGFIASREARQSRMSKVSPISQTVPHKGGPIPKPKSKP